MRTIQWSSSSLKRIAAAVAVAAGVVATGTLAATPAQADHRDHWRGHRHHHHHRHHQGGFFYHNPPVYYAPPPVYYYPRPAYVVPQPSVNFGLSFPIR